MSRKGNGVTLRWRPWFNMDRVEIVVSRANGEVVFWDFLEKWRLGIEIDKMVKRGRLSTHLQKASELSKEWGAPQYNRKTKTGFLKNHRPESLEIFY
jgi:hypothetical protein